MLSAVLALGGCEASRSVVDAVTGRSKEPLVPRIYYAGAARVALHRRPDPSSEVVGELRLHEGVLRTESEGEFAYVTSERTGLRGWVRAEDLIDRLPAARTPTARPPPSKPPPSEPPPSESAPSEPPNPEAPGDRDKPEGSIFDPY